MLNIQASKVQKMNFILVLDGVTDVGNIGAIARTAYSLGIEGLISCWY